MRPFVFPALVLLLFAGGAAIESTGAWPVSSLLVLYVLLVSSIITRL